MIFDEIASAASAIATAVRTLPTIGDAVTSRIADYQNSVKKSVLANDFRLMSDTKSIYEELDAQLSTQTTIFSDAVGAIRLPTTSSVGSASWVNDTIIGRHRFSAEAVSVRRSSPGILQFRLRLK